MKAAIAAIAAATIVMFAANAPAEAGMVSPKAAKSAVSSDSALVLKVGGRFGRRGAVGLAIGLGVLGAVAASRAHAERRYYVERYEESREHSCRRWFRQCDLGNDRACWKFERRC